MRTALAWVNTLNSVVFLFDAVQHAGIALGSFHEPRIVSAAIVEVACGSALAWAALASFSRSDSARRVVLIANVAALTGVALGIAALAMGAGPRTASNDLYHRMMLALIAMSFLLLSFRRSATSNGAESSRPPGR